MAEMPDQMIYHAFMLAWEEFGDDKSTEFLIQITADRMGVGVDDVCAALASEQSPAYRETGDQRS